jgi:hypothetical protein
MKKIIYKNLFMKKFGKSVTVFHKVLNPSNNLEIPFYQVVAIDPAPDNFALRIERRHFNGLIEPIAFEKVKVKDVSGGTCSTYNNISLFLNKYSEHYKETTHAIVEKQPPLCEDNIRIAQHVISYFTFALSSSKYYAYIVELAAHKKGTMLGAPRGLKYYHFKKWTTSKAIELFIARKDEVSLKIIRSAKKKDDYADAALLIEVFFLEYKLIP